jgi:mersacidin/lichenicidin family type 2 lantibiotic
MKLDITRAWKDELYRLSLSEEDLLTLPESPVGGLELSDDILDTVYGGWGRRRREHHREHRREHHEHHEHHEHDNSWSEDDSWSESDSED